MNLGDERNLQARPRRHLRDDPLEVGKRDLPLDLCHNEIDPVAGTQPIGCRLSKIKREVRRSRPFELGHEEAHLIFQVFYGIVHYQSLLHIPLGLYNFDWDIARFAFLACRFRIVPQFSAACAVYAFLLSTRRSGGGFRREGALGSAGFC